MAKPVHSRPTLTVFADASVMIERKVAGWGGWARGDDRKSLLLGGPLPYHPNSTVAELMALAAMIEGMDGAGYRTEADTSIMLQSDSLHALQYLNTLMPNSFASKHKGADARKDAKVNRARKMPPDVVAPAKRIAEALAGAEIVYLRHIKGHQNGSTTRSWVNEQCDLRAKQEARAQIPSAAAK